MLVNMVFMYLSFTTWSYSYDEENSIKSKISKLESDKCKSLQATNNEAAFNININLILILLSLQLQFNFF